MSGDAINRPAYGCCASNRDMVVITRDWFPDDGQNDEGFSVLAGLTPAEARKLGQELIAAAAVAERPHHA